MSNVSAAAFADTKPHYNLLDGLRGVAALTVVCFHLFEAYATSHLDQRINHGYLAVDFFFILSGFVIGYAYDDRWEKMTVWEFLKRRIIRLHPMVVIGALIGAVMFYFQGCSVWDVSTVSVGALLIATLMNALLIPATPGAEIRGVGEMFPLNGPSWSLFFEYIGSILYAVVLHRLSKKALAAVTVLSGIGLAAVILGNVSGAYHVGVGWSAGGLGFLGGFFRLSFSFSAGLLMSRSFRKVRIRGAFWICAAAIALILSCPYVTTDGNVSVLNGVYDCVCTLFLFPAIVYVGACGATTDRFSTNTCEFLGQLSYPVYIIHYPVMYLFYAWVWNNGITLGEALPICAALFVGIIFMAWLALRFYDTPLRRYLSSRLL